MSELFAPGGNFSLLIRIVACVRGEQRCGPVQANSAPNEECLVNVWSSLQMAKFLPNNIRTPDGMLGSRTRMASTHNIAATSFKPKRMRFQKVSSFGGGALVLCGVLLKVRMQSMSGYTTNTNLSHCFLNSLSNNTQFSRPCLVKWPNPSACSMHWRSRTTILRSLGQRC